MLDRTRLVLVGVVLSLLVCHQRAFAQDAAVDDEGFIRNWLVLAPIPSEGSGSDDLEKKQIKDEGMIKPKVGEKLTVGGKELTWKAVKTKEFFFDVCEIIGAPGETGVSYAVAYVVADQEMKDLELAMGSNDEGLVYLNGKEVVKFAEPRTLEKDTDVAKGVSLNMGVYVIVFKVVNESNNWQGCLRFKKGDKPVKELKVRMTAM